MIHLWVRAEHRANETRVGLTPTGAAALIKAGFRVTIEQSPTRVIAHQDYLDAGCESAPQHSWPEAPRDAIIFGLKELPDDGTPLFHRHIMFGHAFKRQPAGQTLLARFRAGQGRLLDLEYLVDDQGRRVAAFGYWAGYAGAAVALMCWAAQQAGGIAGAVSAYASSQQMEDDVQYRMEQAGHQRPSALVIGALGRVGRGAADLCARMQVPVTRWDMAETAHGGPFPEVLDHALFFNCILARPGTPVFVPESALSAQRSLSVIGDIACDPDSDFSPIKVYDRVTTWETPALRVADAPVLDVTAIDNLPSLLPAESSVDFADQLLPHLMQLNDPGHALWSRADAEFQRHLKDLPA